MNAEVFDSGICDACPLAQLQDNEQAMEARAWAFSPPHAHEGFLDPRFPTLGMMAMHYGSLCRNRNLTGACTVDAPEIPPPASSE